MSFSGHQHSLERVKVCFAQQILYSHFISMSNSEIESVIQQLAGASVETSSLLTYEGKGFKLDNENDAKQIIEDINSTKNITALCLTGNTVGVEAAKAIAKALEGHPEFQRALWSDMFTGRLKTEIPDALRYLGGAIMLAGARLVELDLSDNAFGPNGMKGLTHFLKSESCYSLQELRLHNNGLGVTGGKMLAKSLLDCHEASVKAGTPLALRVFVSGRGRLENEGSTALAEAFKAMGSLEEVQMPQNGINHQGITALAQAFSVNRNLRHLNLNDNTFTQKGARSMAKALPKLTKLEVMNFGDCLVRSEGAEALAASIKGLTGLKEVILSFNEINRVGANSVAESMRNKDNLELLDLDGNNLGDDGKDLVAITMENMGKGRCLGSLEEDDGSEDETEARAGGKVEDEEEEEEPDDDEDGDEVDDPQLTVRGTGLTTRPQQAAEFLQTPSTTKLQELTSHLDFIEHLGDSSRDIEQIVSTFMKISSIVTKDDHKTKAKACQCIDGLFKQVLDQEGQKNTDSLLSNAILVHIGLLKSEDKKFQAASNITGALITLEHIIQQSYFPKGARTILQLFIGKAHPVLDKHRELKHALLQTMYKF